MRTFEEIKADMDKAAEMNNSERMFALADEMEATSSDKARALSFKARGYAHRLLRNASEAIRNYELSAELEVASGDLADLARTYILMGAVYAGANDYEKALELYHRALATSKDIDSADGIAFAYERIGSVHSDAGEFARALDACNRALALHERSNNKKRIATTANIIGNIYRRTSDYPTALTYYRRALDLHEELNNQAGIALVTGNIGTAFNGAENRDEAMTYYERALATQEAIGALEESAITHLNIGNIHYARNNFSQALASYERGRELSERFMDRDGTDRAVNSIVSVLIEDGRFDDAADILRSYDTESAVSRISKAYFMANRGDLAVHNNDLDAAHELFTRALEIVLEIGARSAAADFHERLRELAQKRNDFAAYIEHNNEHNRISEEIRGKEAIQKLSIMEAERKMEAERREHEKHRSLLYGALPKSVADRMIRGEDVSGDHFENAAVMFIDIVGFTMHTSHMPPSDVVKLLENIFRTLDALCDEHSVVKIKTVGDSYMCFRGDADAPTNALSVARVALAVARHPRTWPTGEPLNVRIGIHLGPATAGVIGTQRLQYDVWGDTVNVASRMESSSQRGNIHVSQAFAEALDPGFRRGDAVDGHPGEGRDPYRAMVADAMKLQERGEVEIKGKGSMTTFWLTS